MTLKSEDNNKLAEFYKHLDGQNKRFLGYPCNGDFDYTELWKFLQFPINNIGDPSVDSYYHLHSHDFETEVINFFADLYKMPENEKWGYVTNGGTEGNLHGLYLAKTLYPEGIVYYSNSSHYSIKKIIHLANSQSIQIKSTKSGRIDYADLESVISANRDKPAIIFANLGTTMTGACDNVYKIKEILNNNAINDSYIHADGALFGMILPFIETDYYYDFEHHIDSISISGHKMIGSPIPCGIVLAKKSNVRFVAKKIDYVGSVDTTINGSRNGITPLFLWYAIKNLGYEGFKKRVESCLSLAEYASDKFLRSKIPATRNRHSPIVVFDTMNIPVLNKWQIAISGDQSHIVTMPHVTKGHINQLIEEILEDDE